MRQSGGLARIESTLGRGTTVRLLLPLHERLEAVDLLAAVPAPEGGGLHGMVLLVDDEDAVRVRRPSACASWAQGAGSAGRAEALRVLTAAHPDLLVTDVGLPNGMNGRQLAEAMRERLPGLPVLFITGYAGTKLSPGVEVIGKPFGLDDLAERVQAVLRGSDTDRVG